MKKVPTTNLTNQELLNRLTEATESRIDYGYTHEMYWRHDEYDELAQVESDLREALLARLARR